MLTVLVISYHVNQYRDKHGWCRLTTMKSMEEDNSLDAGHDHEMMADRTETMMLRA